MIANKTLSLVSLSLPNYFTVFERKGGGNDGEWNVVSGFPLPPQFYSLWTEGGREWWRMKRCQWFPSPSPITLQSLNGRGEGMIANTTLSVVSLSLPNNFTVFERKGGGNDREKTLSVVSLSLPNYFTVFERKGGGNDREKTLSAVSLSLPNKFTVFERKGGGNDSEFNVVRGFPLPP